ncbi:unnamed protein product [Prorocentrum cordatum]|uniref:Protein-serine/threonine kinase n=1 Tax=Prorocentrum cordatum TaxID=2364126 RepID=A0ABN9W158_9DINO|nr:unnamed protein product [Polarella glacialis]
MASLAASTASRARAPLLRLSSRGPGRRPTRRRRHRPQARRLPSIPAPAEIDGAARDRGGGGPEAAPGEGAGPARHLRGRLWRRRGPGVLEPAVGARDAERRRALDPAEPARGGGPGHALQVRRVQPREGEPRWEGIENRRWGAAGAPVGVHMFDRTGVERAKRPPGQGRVLAAGGSSIDEFVAHVAEEDRSRSSYRLKLELPRQLLEEDRLGSLGELACLQAYLTFIASGQIVCKEDGGHHRPNAAAKAAQVVTEALWDVAKQGDAELFVARRIFPSLPSFSDEFTCAVPMTRIRDIAHRNDIPKDIKLYIKHEIQNKLHRCADPGDLVKLDRLVERIDREGGYSEGFVHEIHIFQVELRSFFNASGLDDSARQLAAQVPSIRPAVDNLLLLKGQPAPAPAQLEALAALRRVVAPRTVEEEQNWLRLDVELDRYAFVLLSQVAGGLDGDAKASVGRAAARHLLHPLTATRRFLLAGWTPWHVGNTGDEGARLFAAIDGLAETTNSLTTGVL